MSEYINEIDPITLESLDEIKEDELIILEINDKKRFYNCNALYQWININPIDPITKIRYTIEQLEYINKQYKNTSKNTNKKIFDKQLDIYIDKFENIPIRELEHYKDKVLPFVCMINSDILKSSMGLLNNIDDEMKEEVKIQALNIFKNLNLNLSPEIEEMFSSGINKIIYDKKFSEGLIDKFDELKNKGEFEISNNDINNHINDVLKPNKN